MKKIAISIRNRVFSESIFLMLGQTGEFQPARLPSTETEIMRIECAAVQPEIVLMDVTPAQQETALETRIRTIEELRREMPACKFVLLCDEVAYPELAQEVMRAKQTRNIDAFFYASVTAEYLTAALDAL